MTLLLLALTVACDGHFLEGPILPAPARMDVISGQEQYAKAGTQLPAPLIVRVTGAAGEAIPGQIVNFRVTEGGGVVFAGASLTDSLGLAQEWWTLGAEPGPNAVEARAVDSGTGERVVFASFYAIGLSEDPVLTSLDIEPDTVSFTATGQTEQLLAGARDQFGNPYSAPLAWNSVDAAIAGVDPTGLATANGYGTTGIVVSDAATGLADTAVVVVASPDTTPPGVPGRVTMATAWESADSFRVTAAWGPAVDAASYDWVTGTESGAWETAGEVADTTVVFRAPHDPNSGGYWFCTTAVDAAGNRSTQMACNAYSAPQDTSSQPVATVTVSPASASLNVGGSIQLTATLTDAQGDTLTGRTVTWSSSNSAVASVSTSGLVSAVAEGQATIAATSEGVSGSSAISVADTTTTNPGQRPNEPPGFTRWLEHNMATLPNGALSGAGFAQAQYGSHYTMIDEPQRPVGSGQVLRIRYSRGMDDGVSPGAFFAWDQTSQAAATPLKEWYVSIWVKLEGADWEWPPAALKLWYNGVGEKGYPNLGGPVMLRSRGAFTIQTSADALLQVWRSCRSCVSTESVHPYTITVGQWHHIEHYGKISTPDQSNGIRRTWIDGVLVAERTDVRDQSTTSGSWTTGFYEFHWAPVFGGYDANTSTVKTRDDYMRISHLYISGLAQ